MDLNPAQGKKNCLTCSPSSLQGQFFCYFIFYKSPRVCSQKVTLALSFAQISLYTGNGGDKRYHNGNEEEGALLVSEGIVKDSVEERKCCVLGFGFHRLRSCTQPMGTFKNL